MHLYGSKYDNSIFTDRGACHEMTFRMKCQVMQQEFHNEDPSSHSGLKSEKLGQFREGTYTFSTYKNLFLKFFE